MFEPGPLFYDSLHLSGNRIFDNLESSFIIINRLQTVGVYSRPQTFSIPCALDQVNLMSLLSSSRSLLAVCRCLSICQCTGDIVCVVFLSL
jgi:hypothetical protein